jgi:hypothetical protein
MIGEEETMMKGGVLAIGAMLLAGAVGLAEAQAPAGQASGQTRVDPYGCQLGQ